MRGWRPQAVEAREAGAAGVLGIVASVSGRGAPVCSSYAAALGLDAPVEVRGAHPPKHFWRENACTGAQVATRFMPPWQCVQCKAAARRWTCWR